MDGYSVGISYLFKSNAKAILGEIVAQSDLATEATDKYTASLKANNLGSRSFIRMQERVAKAVGIAATAIEDAQARIDKAFASTARTATASSTVIADSTRDAAIDVDGSTRMMTRRLGSVTAAYRRASIAAAGFAGSAGALGGGAAIGAAGAGAARSSRHGLTPGTIGQFAAAGMLVLGVHTAANLQDSTAQTAAALGMTSPAAAARYNPLAFKMSASTAQSVANSMALLGVMASSGLNPKQVTDLGMPIAKFADTQYLDPRRHTDFNTSAAMAAKLAHELGTRDSASLTRMLTTLAQVGMMMPDSLSALSSQVKYYGPQFVNAGVAPEEVLRLQATADQLGLSGGRSGTGFRALYQSLQSPSSSKVLKNQRLLGLLDSKGNDRFIDQKTGRFDVEGLFAYLNKRYDAARKSGTMGDFNRELAGISTSGASTVTSLFASDAGRERLAYVKADQKRLGDLDHIQAQLMDTLNNQFKLLATNVASLSAVIATPLMRPLTDFIHALAMGVGALTSLLQAHPTMAGLAAAGIGVAGTIGAYKAIRMGLGLGHAAVSIGRGGPHLTEWLTGGSHGSRAAGTMDRIGSAISRSVMDLLTFRSTRNALGGALGSDAAGNAGAAFMRQFPGFANVGSILENVARGISGMIGPASDLVGVVRFFALGGVRLLPVIGEIFLLIDTIRFLGSHAKDIGKIIGDMAHWIIRDGGPLLVSAIKSVWGYIIDSVKFLLSGIKDSFLGIFNGGKTGIWAWIHNVYASSAAQFKADDAADAAAKKKGAQTRGNVSGKPVSKRRTSVPKKVAMLEDGSTVIHFSGPVSMKVDGADATKAHHSIVKGAIALAERHLPKSTPMSPGLTSSGFTLGDAVLS
jgi:TP901 family phage tail tape measure protein